VGHLRLRTASALSEAVLRGSRRRPFQSEHKRQNKTSPTAGRTGSVAFSVRIAYVGRCPPEVEILRSRFRRRGMALRSILHIITYW